MKRMLKVSLSVVLTVLLLFSFPSTAFAYEYGTPDLKTMVKVQKHGNKESRFISGRDVNRIRISKSAKYKNKTDREKLKEIFEALEINIKDKQFEAVCQTLKLSDIEDIHTEVSYIKTDENGVQTGVSKTEALKVAEESHVTIPITEESAGARSLITHSNPG